jgi:hypothetical protein
VKELWRKIAGSAPGIKSNHYFVPGTIFYGCVKGAQTAKTIYRGSPNYKVEKRRFSHNYPKDKPSTDTFLYEEHKDANNVL